MHIIVDLVKEGYTVKVAYWVQAAQEVKGSLKNPLTVFFLLIPLLSLSLQSKPDSGHCDIGQNRISMCKSLCIYTT